MATRKATTLEELRRSAEDQKALIAKAAEAATAKTPDTIVKRLGEMVRGAVVSPKNEAFWKIQGYEPFPGTGADLARWQRQETEKWGRIVRTAGIEPE